MSSGNFNLFWKKLAFPTYATPQRDGISCCSVMVLDHTATCDLASNFVKSGRTGVTYYLQLSGLVMAIPYSYYLLSAHPFGHCSSPVCLAVTSLLQRFGHLPVGESDSLDVFIILSKSVLSSINFIFFSKLWKFYPAYSRTLCQYA